MPVGHAPGIGEPHYRLSGGQTLSTQRVGEFWLLEASDGTRVQVQQVQWGQCRQVAAIGAIAAQVGAHRVASTWTAKCWSDLAQPVTVWSKSYLLQ